MSEISHKKLSNFFKSPNIFFLDTYQNGTSSKSGFSNSFSFTGTLWNQNLKILRSNSCRPLSVLVRKGVKPELRSAYHNFNFFQNINVLLLVFFFFSFSLSLHSHHKVYNVTSCCLHIHIVMTTVRYSEFDCQHVK